MDQRGGRACHCVLLEAGRTEFPDYQDPMDWIHRPTASELCRKCHFGKWGFLARVVRLATDINDSTRMHCTSTLASPRIAANSNAALQYQVLLAYLAPGPSTSYVCPQGGRHASGSGMLITAADVANTAADSAQLLPMLEESEEMTGARTSVTA